MIIHGDNMIILPTLPEKHFHACVSSPPYWGLRDYGVPHSEWGAVTYTPMSGLPEITVPAWTGCLGLEPTPEMFVAHIVSVYRQVRRVLRDDGTLWVNLGDSYASSPSNKNDENSRDPKSPNKGGHRCRTSESGLKPKDLIGIPWRVAFALQADGWFLRMDNIWSKPNPMPESVTDRPTKAHEYFFLLSKSKKYYFDKDAIMEPLAESSIARLAQNIEGQKGSSRANGNTRSDRTMKAVFTVRGSKGVIDNPLNTGLREEEKPFEPPAMRNKRSVWHVPTSRCSQKS